ncbi:uncharacterized protein [Aegilops tauschii subsp. strangulata]|uniref:uncharacterized protein n=1 Tax=Aegilops tauschii subsp. strangulata TaxID=200361 RepID=UPI00098BC2E1|nr:uncharacterized protein LOC109731903 [Aegilops tauschii subsp. strangulata]
MKGDGGAAHGMLRTAWQDAEVTAAPAPSSRGGSCTLGGTAAAGKDREDEVGNGTEETIGDDYVRLPDNIVISYTKDEKAINTLIEDVFPSLHANAISARATLSTKNDHVDDLNDKMDLKNNYTIDLLNSITPNGLPPRVLRLKANCPVILLRNLDLHNGLYNGTRLMIRAFQDNAIDAEIVGGQHPGKRVFIPRVPMSPSEDISLPLKLKRKQFPIRLSFAMTINKAQGFDQNALHNKHERRMPSM